MIITFPELKQLHISGNPLTIKLPVETSNSGFFYPNHVQRSVPLSFSLSFTSVSFSLCGCACAHVCVRAHQYMSISLPMRAGVLLYVPVCVVGFGPCPLSCWQLWAWLQWLSSICLFFLGGGGGGRHDVAALALGLVFTMPRYTSIFLAVSLCTSVDMCTKTSSGPGRTTVSSC